MVIVRGPLRLKHSFNTATFLTAIFCCAYKETARIILIDSLLSLSYLLGSTWMFINIPLDLFLILVPNLVHLIFHLVQILLLNSLHSSIAYVTIQKKQFFLCACSMIRLTLKELRELNNIKYLIWHNFTYQYTLVIRQIWLKIT